MTSLMRWLIALAGLSGCGTQQASVEGPTFDETRIEIGGQTADVLALDVDRDGTLDLVVASRASSGEGTVTVLLGDGTGRFPRRATVAAGENAARLAAGDFDGDGWTDLVVANHETDYVTLLFGGGEGFEARDHSRFPVGVAPHPHAISAVDLDGDGHLDFLVDDRTGEAIGAFRGRGDGTFEASGSIDVGGDPYHGFALGDLDGDGDLDLVTPNPRTVAVLHGDGTGRFAPALELRMSGLRPFSVAIGDVNGDGIADLGAGSGEGEGGFAVWLGSAGAGYSPDPGSPYPIARGPTAAATRDVNGDGVDDFLITSFLGDELAILFGGRRERRLLRIEVEGNPWAVATGDFNGDGRTDIVTGNDGGGDVSILLAEEG